MMRQDFFNLEIETSGQKLYQFTDRTQHWIKKNNFNKLAPMNNKLYKHTTEGKDDMPAHIKSTLTNNQISLSVKNSLLLLGTWQGIYLFEHRIDPQNRIIIHHFIGD